MRKRSQTLGVILIVLFCCSIMGVVDGIIQPSYWIKSSIKVALFLICPIGYFLVSRDLNLKSLFMPTRKGMKLCIFLGLGVFIIITSAYALLKDVFDFSNITTSLTGGVGVNKENFIWVALYISLVNSLLEEFFFRGFAFLTLKKLTSRTFAYVFSALAFALYHTAMMTGWFSIWAFLLVMIGLSAGGAIFNLLNEKCDSIYPSWIVHISANLAINLIGLRLFGMI